MKKQLFKYTVTGNVKSGETKYRVTEIIEAQDSSLASSIFKERAKKNMGRIRSITKVVVEEYKDGDVASKEEIIENLPKAEVKEEVKTEIPEKDKSVHNLLDIAFNRLSEVDKMTDEIFNRMLNSDNILIIRVQLLDKNKKPIVSTFKITSMDELDVLSKDMYKKPISDLTERDKNRVITFMIDHCFNFIVKLHEINKESRIKLESLDDKSIITTKEKREIMSKITDEHKITRNLIDKIVIEVAKEMNLDELAMTPADLGVELTEEDYKRPNIKSILTNISGISK